MTIAEMRLWDELRDVRRRGYHFRKQAPVETFIVDFACFAHRLIIEVDGAQHGHVDNAHRDSNRDAHLRSLGFNVLRFGNGDVMDNLEGVMLEILAALGAEVRHD